LQEALEDSGHPVFSLPAKELKNNKHPEHFFHFGRGDAYFYIPPFPARGEGNIIIANTKKLTQIQFLRTTSLQLSTTGNTEQKNVLF
jgi:hypothetical protein